MGQVLIGGAETLWNLIFREHRSWLRDLKITPLGNFNGVGHRFGDPSEEVGHLLGALHIELLGGEAHPINIALLLIGPNTEDNVLGIGVARLDVVDIVGRYQRKAELSS